jgi:hypothetical protein
MKSFMTEMCVFSLCYVKDMLLQQANPSMKTQKAALGCRCGFITEEKCGDLNFDTKNQGRYHYQSLGMREEMATLKTKDLLSKYGRV